MATSLAQQLQRLAVPQTSQLKRDKKRPSLLFDPKVAAGHKRDVIYEIGLDGLEELIAKNECFEKYRETLFHFTSKTVERGMQTAEDNKMLNRTIRKFLLLCSPYFLLSSTHRALEWLIYRYSIHEYNREDLLMLIMPYHESNIFVKVVQLLKFKETNDNWYFLKSLQKSGVHLTKQTLLKHCDVAMLKFTTKFIHALIKEHDKPGLLMAPFNFYCTIFLACIENSKQVNEAEVTQMLPALLKGLNSDIGDYCAASYVILARLATKAELTDMLLDKFVDKVTQFSVQGLKTEAVLVLIALFEHQKQYKKIQLEACDKLVEQAWMPKVLQELNQEDFYTWTFLGHFVRALFKYGLKTDKEGYRDFMASLLSAVKMDQEFVRTFLLAVLDSVKPKKKYPDHLTHWISEVIATVERQYPEQFDKEVYKILSTTQTSFTDHRRKETLQKLMQQAMTLKGKFDVFDKLYHPNEQFRSEAIKYVTQHFSALRDSEKKMIRRSLVDRLDDEELSVIKETLALIKKTSILDRTTCRDVLIRLSKKCQTEWQEISVDVLKMLIVNSDADDWNVLLAVFPYLLPSSDSELKRAVQISSVFKNSLFKNWKARQNWSAANFCESVFETIEKSASLELVSDFVQNLNQQPIEKCDTLHKYLATLILSLILPENSAVSIGSSIVDIFVRYLESSCLVRQEKNCSFHFGIKIAREGKFPLESFLNSLCNVIIKIEKPAENLGLYDFASGNDFCRFFILSAKILFKHSEKRSQKFLEHFSDDSKSKIEFMLNLAVSSEANHDFQKDCLKELLKVKKDGVLCGTDEAVVPLVLVLLQSNDKDVRETTLGFIETIVDIETEGETYKLLLDKIIENKEAIVLDEDQLALVLFNLSTKYKKGTKNAKEISKLIGVLVETVCDTKAPISLKAGLMKALTFINSEQILERTAKLALDLLNEDSLVGIKSRVFVKVISKYDSSVARSLNLGSEAWKLLEKALRSDVTKLDKTCPAVAVLKQINKEFVMKLTNDVQPKLLDVMIETASSSQNPEVAPATTSIFKHIFLDANFVLHHLTEMRDIYIQKPKRRASVRNVVVATEEIVETVEWKKGITLLEFVQEKKNVKNMEVLVPVVFEVLKKCLSFIDQNLVEYPKQLILSFILHCCEKIDPKDLPENAFNVESIVNCIREFQNPQTTHHALLVLAKAATFIPSQVLHQIPGIFTFMGSTVLRQDDSYSFQVIAKIIDTLIPILVKDGKMFEIVKVLQVFVDMLDDVPVHRKMPLYKHILSQIGVEDNLHIFLLLVFNAHIQDKTKSKKDEKEEIERRSRKRLEFTSTLCREFAPKVVIKASYNCMQFLKALPDETLDEDDEMDPEVFTIKFDTYYSMKHFKYVLVKFLSELLSSRELVEIIAALEDSEAVKLEEMFTNIIVVTLKFIKRISGISDKHKNTSQAKYWVHLLHLSYNILNNANALLTPRQFVLVIQALMLHDMNVIRRLSLELLSSKLKHNSKYFEDCKDSEMLGLVDSLTKAIGKISDLLDSDQEGVIVAALHSLELLSKLLANKNPDKFVPILDCIVTLIKSKKSKDKILASAVLCLTELCVNIREYALKSINTIMPALLKILERNRSQEFPTRSIASTITALERILDTLPYRFLCDYLEDMLLYVSHFTVKWEHEDNPTINEKLQNIQKKISSVVPSRDLIPVIQKTYATMIEKGVFKSIAPLMNVLSDNLSNLTTEDLMKSLLDELTVLFLTMLEFRSNQKTTLDEANHVENQIIKPLTVMILKLPEYRFKELFNKIHEWALQSHKKDRMITFYTFSSILAEKIQSLFALFAGNIVKNAAELLDACNSTKTEELFFENEQKTELLLRVVLKTLLHLFKHDNQKFINKNRFNLLMQPLVDQLENIGLADFSGRNEELVTPCIAYFTVAVADDSLWKQSNYQILQKMKDSSAKVRLAALHCLNEVAQKLGEEFGPLLQETINYLSELLEDEDENVEKACRSVVQQMETAIGISLQEYFKA